MGESVVHLPSREIDSVVGVITDLLAKAKRGEITSIAVALLYADGDVGRSARRPTSTTS